MTILTVAFHLGLVVETKVIHCLGSPLGLMGQAASAGSALLTWQLPPFSPALSYVAHVSHIVTSGGGGRCEAGRSIWFTWLGGQTLKFWRCSILKLYFFPGPKSWRSPLDQGLIIITSDPTPFISHLLIEFINIQQIFTWRLLCVRCNKNLGYLGNQNRQDLAYIEGIV